MVGETWNNEQKRRLRAMTIDPTRSSPERLKAMIDYFRTPGVTLYGVTVVDRPFHVSKELGTKIRDYQADGKLDWILDESTDQPGQEFDAAWRDWLMANAADFSMAVNVYRQELGFQIESTEIYLGLRFVYTPRRIPYGALHQPFIESIFSRDRELAYQRTEFESVLKAGDLAGAMKLRETIESRLIKQIAI